MLFRTLEHELLSAVAILSNRTTSMLGRGSMESTHRGEAGMSRSRRAQKAAHRRLGYCFCCLSGRWGGGCGICFMEI